MRDLKELLLADLPDRAISQHPTKTYLSTIKAIYVTERFNDVFGVGKWQTQIEKEHLNLDTGMVIIKVTFKVPEHDIYYECYGGNDNGGINNKNFDLGDAYKGATTDALTKIGSYLGVGIKVFKGLHKSGQTAKPEKEWLNVGDKHWIGAVKKKASLDDVKKYYRISKENSELYLKEITKTIE